MFSRSASFVASSREWASLSARRNSATAAATAYARAHMVAVVMCADDSAIGFFFDVANDRVSRVTYQNVVWTA